MSSEKLNANLINDEIKEFEGATKNQQLEKIQNMKNELQESIKKKEENEDPDNLLYQNIERANRFLDTLEHRIMNPNEQGKKESTSRLFEVSAQLINAITSATQSIVGAQKDDMEYQYKLELLELKNKELMVKSAMKGGESGKGHTTNNNLIVTSREQLLDMIDQNEEDSDQEKEN